MGAFGSLLVTLFSLCFRKLKTRAETTTRLIILTVITVLFVALVLIIGDPTGWTVFAIYALLFGWRILADIVQIISNKFDPPRNDDNEK